MGAGTLIDLSQLPAPAVVEALDVESYVAAFKADLITRDPTLADVLALESEPIVKLLEACAYRELLIRNRINVAAAANMLGYASGPDLDNLVANFGVQRLAGELDPALLARAIEAPDGWSTAGPINAYKYHAKSADPSVADVAVSQPSPGQVRVAVLSSDPAGAPSAAVLAAVDAALSDEDVRPFTDQVLVVAAGVTGFDVVAQLLVGQGADPSLLVTAAETAVQAYAAGQRKLGAKISRNALIARLLSSGADDVVLTSPAADVAGATELAPQLGQLNVTAATDQADG